MTACTGKMKVTVKGLFLQAVFDHLNSKKQISKPTVSHFFTMSRAGRAFQSKTAILVPCCFSVVPPNDTILQRDSLPCQRQSTSLTLGQNCQKQVGKPNPRTSVIIPSPESSMARKMRSNLADMAEVGLEKLLTALHVPKKRFMEILHWWICSCGVRVLGGHLIHTDIVHSTRQKWAELLCVVKHSGFWDPEV